ncbi:GGDEF domain-containing protein [Aestuariibacter halophilus]|uniref:diguanylate cyclase n=1 Tax=Fluctibacter halophilus TaxID=226011 RepID=A0ABS8GBR3_9ALTE|nr:GGDEF domain-containing protein [Aestuariibacter halophilus]MCC2618005.1 GGDEF domain-containing protein [Aestuariibacter halophilus]
MPHSDQDKLFQRVLLIGSLVVVTIWFVEQTANLLAYYDTVGYGVTVVVTLGCYFLSRLASRTELAKVILFYYLTLYLVALAILSFVEALNWHSIYPLASTLQWMPIIYIVAFLFLTQKAAIVSALFIYLVLIMLMAITYTPWVVITEPQIRVLLLNMVLAHGVYIFCMFAVVRIRQTHLATEVRARQMEKAANVDGLTGLASRRALQKAMEDTLLVDDEAFLLIIDVDHFKPINDTHGHVIGDEVLQRVAQAMKASVRPEDIIGRWGGEEFLVIIHQSTLAQVHVMADRIRASVERLDIEGVGCVTVSIGVGSFRLGDTVSQVLSNADEALYAAKQGGRNQVVLVKGLADVAQG